jgi:hypothetical protein
MMLVHLLRVLGAAFVTAVLATCALGAAASAHTKPYSVVVSPSSVPGGQRATFTATFTNRADEQKLGSARLTAPFSVVSASVPAPGTATVSGNVVKLGNLALRPAKSIAVTVVADVPCTEGTFTWAVKAKPTSDFSGSAEFDPLVKSSLSTAVTAPASGGCVATVCAANVTCTATLSNGTVTLAVTAPSTSENDAGVLVISRNVGAALNCKGYTELSQGDFAVDFLPNQGSTGRAKVVTATITKEAMTRLPENGAAHINMCFGAPFRFPVKPGTPRLQQFDGLFVGLLPDCGSPPCVSKRKKTHAGQGVIEVRAPGGDQDPRYSP